jgi:hypothetical protein
MARLCRSAVPKRRGFCNALSQNRALRRAATLLSGAGRARRARNGVMETDRPPHILVVDDHREIRDALTRYLQKNGLRADGAADAPAMDRALAEGAYDLIILDVMMPGEDGLSVCRRLRADARHPDPDADRARRGRPTASSGWSSAPTTTSPSRSTRARCWRGSRRSCAARSAPSAHGGAHARRTAPALRPAGRWTPTAADPHQCRQHRRAAHHRRFPPAGRPAGTPPRRALARAAARSDHRA